MKADRGLECERKGLRSVREIRRTGRWRCRLDKRRGRRKMVSQGEGKEAWVLRPS